MSQETAVLFANEAFYLTFTNISEIHHYSSTFFKRNYSIIIWRIN